MILLTKSTCKLANCSQIEAAQGPVHIISAAADIIPRILSSYGCMNRLTIVKFKAKESKLYAIGHLKHC